MIEYPIRFLHIIKTGGSTIARHLSKHVDGFRDLDMHREPAPGSSLVFEMGHNMRPGGSGSMITIWRDPAAWLTSGYNHACARGYSGSFLEWYEAGKRDGVNLAGGRYSRMVIWCSTYWKIPATVEAVIEVLEDCELVLLTEELDQDLPELFRFLGVPETYERRRVAGEFDPEDGVFIPCYRIDDQNLLERIREENPADYEIYNYVKKRRAKQ